MIDLIGRYQLEIRDPMLQNHHQYKSVGHQTNFNKEHQLSSRTYNYPTFSWTTSHYSRHSTVDISLILNIKISCTIVPQSQLSSSLIPQLVAYIQKVERYPCHYSTRQPFSQESNIRTTQKQTYTFYISFQILTQEHTKPTNEVLRITPKLSSFVASN